MLAIALPVYLPQAIHSPVWVLSASLALNSLLVIGCQTVVVRLLEPIRRTRALAMAAFIWCVSCCLFVLAFFVPDSLCSSFSCVVVLHPCFVTLYTDDKCVGS